MLRSFIITLIVVTALDAAALFLLLRPIRYEPFTYGRHKTEIPAGWVRTAADDAGEDGIRLRFEKPDLDGAWLELSWTPETAPFEAVLDRLEGALRRAEYQRDLDMFGNGRYFIFDRPREGERIRYAALFTARKRLYRVEVGTRFSAHAKYQDALFHVLEHLRILDMRPHPSLERELAALRRDTEPAYAQPSSRWLMGGLAVPVAFVIPMWIVWMLAGGRPDAAQLRGERVEREELGVTVKVRKRRGGGEYLSAVYLTDQFFRAFTSGRPLLLFPLYYPGERLVAAEEMRGGRWLHIRLGEYPDTDYFFHVADPEAWVGEIERKFGEFSGVRQRVAEEVSRDNREVSLVDRAYEGRSETVLEASPERAAQRSAVFAGLAPPAPGAGAPAPDEPTPADRARFKPAAAEPNQNARRVLASLLDAEAMDSPPGEAEDWLAAVAREKRVAAVSAEAEAEPGGEPEPESEAEAEEPEEEEEDARAEATGEPRFAAPHAEPEAEEPELAPDEAPSEPYLAAPRLAPEAEETRTEPDETPSEPYFATPRLAPEAEETRTEPDEAPSEPYFATPRLAPEAEETGTEPDEAPSEPYFATPRLAPEAEETGPAWAERSAPESAFPAEPKLEEVVAGAVSRALRAASEETATARQAEPTPIGRVGQAAPDKPAAPPDAFSWAEAIPAESKHPPVLADEDRADIDDFEIPGRD